jgi:hypothetical protein
MLMLGRGQKLTIEAVGTTSEKIEQGAYVNLQVKYGLIKLLSTRADMCEQIGNVDLKCPVEKGKITLTKDVDIPANIPGVSLSFEIVALYANLI